METFHGTTILSVRRDGGNLRVHAGTGAESIVDAPLLEAALAQPMGVTAGIDRLYFADAESSDHRGVIMGWRN